GDPQGAAYWIAQLRNGMPIESFQALLVGSAEYYDNAGGTDDDWVDFMYGNILSRDVDQAGHDYFIQQLQDGASRPAIASAILFSSEYLDGQIASLYHVL